MFTQTMNFVGVDTAVAASAQRRPSNRHHGPSSQRTHQDPRLQLLTDPRSRLPQDTLDQYLCGRASGWCLGHSGAASDQGHL